MKSIHIFLCLAALSFAAFMPMRVMAQSVDSRLDKLEQKVGYLEYRVSENGAVGLAVFVCAAFCALWAQQTGRNAWLWFFLGVFFNVITLLVLLHKNSLDKRSR
jgi:hypothetical protein